MGNIYTCFKMCIFLCSQIQGLCTLYFTYIFKIQFDEVTWRVFLKNIFGAFLMKLSLGGVLESDV